MKREFWKKLLESVRDFADEIVIVDSGSTDRTKEIAEKYGAKFIVREVAWLWNAEK